MWGENQKAYESIEGYGVRPVNVFRALFLLKFSSPGVERFTSTTKFKPFSACPSLPPSPLLPTHFPESSALSSQVSVAQVERAKKEKRANIITGRHRHSRRVTIRQRVTDVLGAAVTRPVSRTNV